MDLYEGSWIDCRPAAPDKILDRPQRQAHFRPGSQKGTSLVTLFYREHARSGVSLTFGSWADSPGSATFVPSQRRLSRIRCHHCEKGPTYSMWVQLNRPSFTLSIYSVEDILSLSAPFPYELRITQGNYSRTGGSLPNCTSPQDAQFGHICPARSRRTTPTWYVESFCAFVKAQAKPKE